MPGEQVFRLPPLQLPGVADAPDERFGALRLFAERARAVDRQFVLDASNGAAVADICRRLDGLPLAIELAAARVKLLGVQALRNRLGERLRLLTTGTRDALPRHQTLRAALEWSHGLLSPEEQTVLRRLAVFVGGFTLELAQKVAADGGTGDALDEWTVLDVLGALVDKSMVSVDPGEPVRYRLLETLRVFAGERLAAAGETDAVRRGHARAVAELFAAVDEARWGDAGTVSAGEMKRLLQPEVDNARSALDWAVDHADWPVAITLAGAAAATFEQLAMLRDFLPTLSMLRAHLDEAPASAQVNLLWRLGTGGIQGGMGHEELHRVKAEAVARARAAGFRRRLQAVLASLGFTLARRGDLEATESILAELRSLERADDPAYIRGQRLTVEMMVHEHRNDLEQVVASLGAQRAVLLGAPDESLPLMYCESNLVTYLNSLGRHAEAADLGLGLLARPDLPRSFLLTPCMTAYALASIGRPGEALEVLRRHRSELASSPIGVNSGEALAMLCLAGGRLADAVRIDAALERDIRKSGAKPHPFTLAFRARLHAALDAAQVHPDDLRRWQAEGQALSNAGAVDLALR